MFLTFCLFPTYQEVPAGRMCPWRATQETARVIQRQMCVRIESYYCYRSKFYLNCNIWTLILLQNEMDVMIGSVGYDNEQELVRNFIEKLLDSGVFRHFR
jgi:hypothetical protein